MNVDFLDAHERHMEDAETLYTGAKWANADHLYGVAAECGLKELMRVFGMPVATDGSPVDKKKDWKHLPGLWQRYESYRSGYPAGTSYSLPSPDLFSGWDISQRYAARSNFTQTVVDTHRQGANAVADLIEQAKQNGLI
jgi:hypothetical protein